MKYLIICAALFGFTSCGNQQEEQNLEQLNKKSAREVTLMTQKQGDSVLHISKQIIWSNGDKIAEKIDTIITANKVNAWGSSDTAQQLSQVPIYVTVQ